MNKIDKTLILVIIGAAFLGFMSYVCSDKQTNKQQTNFKIVTINQCQYLLSDNGYIVHLGNCSNHVVKQFNDNAWNCSWGDTLTEEQVLEMLKELNQ